MAVGDDRTNGPRADTVSAQIPDAPSPPARGFVHLKARADFLRVAKGARFHTPAFSLQATPGNQGDAAPARFGLTVTKKIGGAVQRNRIRRRIREALRIAALAAEPGHDYVVVARREALVAPFTQLAEDLRRALQRVHGEAVLGRRGGRRRDRAPAATMSIRPSDLDVIVRRGGHGEPHAASVPGQTQSGENQ